MKHVFELRPLLVAAAAGGVFLALISYTGTLSTSDTEASLGSEFMLGATIGALVQITVRFTGVS